MMTGLVLVPEPLIVSVVVVRLTAPLTLYRLPAAPPRLMSATMFAHERALASDEPSPVPAPASVTYLSVSEMARPD
jgi:hypothetical protein